MGTNFVKLISLDFMSDLPGLSVNGGTTCNEEADAKT